jgi:SulP family sulfate permease
VAVGIIQPVLVPKLFSTLRHYDGRQFSADVVAGVIVGIVAIPLAIAFAIASGLPPAAGLWTAIVAGFLISALGGSRVQIGGPTGAFVVIVYGIVQQHGVDGLAVATLMAGAILVALGLLRLGSMIRYVPFPVITGFTSAIGVTIGVQQFDSALGLEAAAYPPHAVARIVAYTEHLASINGWALGICALTIAILILWPRISEKLPAPFVALVAATALTSGFDLPVVTIGDRFGALSSALPQLNIPTVGWEQLRVLVVPALTIAGLGAIESLLSAVVADGMIGGRHRANVELVAQGIANLASPLIGGMPATGAIARTATNVKAGGRTPVAGIVHALTLLLVTLFFGRWAALLPLASLAGILLVVAYRMLEWKVFVAELRGARSDAVVLLAVFLLTLLVDLTAGIGVGMVLAAFLFMRRMADLSGVRSFASDDDGDDAGPEDEEGLRRRVPPGVSVFELSGPLFFGAAARFRDALAEISRRPDVLIIRLRNVPVIDSTGVQTLRDLSRQSRKEGTLLLMTEAQAGPLETLRRSGLLDELGEGNHFATLDLALTAVAKRSPETASSGHP